MKEMAMNRRPAGSPPAKLKCERADAADSEPAPPCAHASAREKSLKNFRLVPLRRRYVQRCRALAVITQWAEKQKRVRWLCRGRMLRWCGNIIGAQQSKATGQKNSIASALTVKH